MDIESDIKRVVWLLLAILLVSLCGCTTTKYIPIETTHTEVTERVITDTTDIRHLRHIIDSLSTERTTQQRDCVVIILDTAGTIRLRQEYHNTTNTIKTLHSQLAADSAFIYKQRLDSVMKKREEIDVISAPIRQMTRWEKFKSDWFGYIIVVLLAALAVINIKSWWKNIKNKSNI